MKCIARARLSALLSTCCFMLVAAASEASVSSGTIDASSYKTRICHDTTCTSPAPGVVNFKPTGTTAVTIDDVAGIDGIGWGSEVGWITFDPSGVEAVTITPSTGALAGKAWAQGSGWINFRPANSGTTALGVPIGVSITSAGEFYGWAWTGGPNGGWMLFDCTHVSSCVKTDWRPIPARPVVTPPVVTGGGNGPVAGAGSGGSPSDMCWNVDGIQFDTPPAMSRVGNECFVDACLNIPGMQSSVPSNFTLDSGGLCIPSVDYCKNINGPQPSVPVGMQVTPAGNCVVPVTEDALSALTPGVVDPQLPSTLEVQNEDVLPGVGTDVCPNLEGIQTEMPVGFTGSSIGWCVPSTLDYCPNYPGVQSVLPPQTTITESGSCEELEVFSEIPVDPDTNILPVLSLSFVPESLRIAADLPALTRAVLALLPRDSAVIAISSPQYGSIDPLSPAVVAPMIDVVALGIVGSFGSGLLAGLLMLLGLMQSSGVVYNALNQQPLVNATLEVYSSAGTLVKTVLTNDSGKYWLRLGKGEYTIKVRVPRYEFKKPGIRTDGKYKALYQGGSIRVSRFSKIIHDIPMHPLGK